MNFDNPLCDGLDTHEFYFQEASHPKNIKEMKAMCAECPVLSACYEWSLHKEIYGFWAGTTHIERKRLRKSAGIPEPTYQSHDFVGLSKSKSKKVS